MKLHDAISQRKTVRAFETTAVSMDVLRSVIEAAGQSPSNGNLQPWRLIVATGKTLELLKTRTLERLENTKDTDAPEYDVYPNPLNEPYLSLRREVGEDLYKLLGIERGDRIGRRKQFAKNAAMFDAPVGLFLYIDRQFSLGQWLDSGMYLQSLMLLLQAEGLSSCAQGYWTMFHKTVAECLNPEPEWSLACGLAVGFEDKNAAINQLKATRMPLEDYVTFVD